MTSRRHARRGPPRPLDSATLHDVALRYVGKYATTRAKLGVYLSRKIRERGWEADSEPNVEAIAERFAALGYIDDAAFALAQSRALGARGYGKRRVAEKLRLAGIDPADGAEATALAEAEAVDAAVRFAKRRRIGPFANFAADLPQREKWIAAMIRAGHGFPVARALAAMAPGSEIDEGRLRDVTGLGSN